MGVKVSNNSEKARKSLLRNGFAFLDPGFSAPLESMETVMDKLDQEMIDKMNSAYNEKKIIKSSGVNANEKIDRYGRGNQTEVIKNLF